MDNLKIIRTDLLDKYIQLTSDDVEIRFHHLQDSALSIKTFRFYTSVSAVFSSKIEGEDIELDSYIKHKRFGAHFLPDYTRKIDDLYDAYLFAQQTKLTATAVTEAHALITKHILQSPRQGKIRTGNMFVITKDGKIEYVAAEPGIVEIEMKKLFVDINTLLLSKLSLKEVLFFASMVHLVFVKIHPFEDGNGRTARLLEKWFLSELLGAKAWFVQSERNYYNQHQTYYKNIRELGIEYPELDYSKALPFLHMLPQAIAKAEY